MAIRIKQPVPCSHPLYISKRSCPDDGSAKSHWNLLYVLYYLRLGQIPRNPNASVYHSLLSKEDIDGLQMQGDFFGLTGLVNLCKEKKDVLKGVEGTGDLDLTDFSNFSVEIAKRQYRPQFHCTIWYQYKNETWVYANIEENIYRCIYGGGITDKELSIEVTSDGKTILNTDEARDIVDSLKKVFRKAIESDGRMSVTRVLDQVQDRIPPEARLWFAIIVNKMIEFHKKILLGSHVYLSLDEIGGLVCRLLVFIEPTPLDITLSILASRKTLN